jgi:hypothetical protein
MRALYGNKTKAEDYLTMRFHAHRINSAMVLRSNNPNSDSQYAGDEGVAPVPYTTMRKRSKTRIRYATLREMPQMSGY